MAYSVDLRKRMVGAVLEGNMTVAETAKSFGVGSATVERTTHARVCSTRSKKCCCQLLVTEPLEPF